MQDDAKFTRFVSGGRLERCLRHIECNIGRPIRLHELADVAALSPYHLSRSFKRATGKAPMRYILEQRIEAAKAMLENPDTMTATIAYACGFSSQSHFCTAFKQVTGMTTCDYRRSLT